MAAHKNMWLPCFIMCIYGILAVTYSCWGVVAQLNENRKVQVQTLIYKALQLFEVSGRGKIVRIRGNGRYGLGRAGEDFIFSWT